MSRLRSITGAFLAAFLMLGMIWISPFPAAADPADTTYKIYPIPKEVSYGEDTWVLKDFNAVLDNEVDDATRARLKEVADLKGFSVTERVPIALENKHHCWGNRIGRSGQNCYRTKNRHR